VDDKRIRYIPKSEWRGVEGESETSGSLHSD